MRLRRRARSAPKRIETRDDWIAFADQLIASYDSFKDPDCPWNLRVPGRAGVHGLQCDALEGFARRLLLIAFRLQASDVPLGRRLLSDTVGELEGAGLALARKQPNAWPSVIDHMQPNVEAAAIAISLLIARDQLWESLSDEAASGIAEWMSPVAARRGDQNNWVMFGACVETFLVAVGRAEPSGAVEFADAAADRWYRGDGWYSDGPRMALDYYNNWAFHFYPLLLAHYSGDPARKARYAQRLAEFLPSLDAAIDHAGRPIAWGRSLTYRFGMLAPYWIDQAFGAASSDPGTVRQQSFAVVNAFLDDGAIEDGIFTIGWRGPDESLAQDYSCAASSLWAAKAFAGLLLPADHPVWSAAPAPSMPADPRFPAGQLLPDTGTGAARLFNEGLQGQTAGVEYEDRFYLRHAYSSATLPREISGSPDNSFTSARGPAGQRAIADFAGIELRAYLVEEPQDAERFTATGWATDDETNAQAAPLLGFDRREELKDGDFQLTAFSGAGADGRFLLATSLGDAPPIDGVTLVSDDGMSVTVRLPSGQTARVEYAPQLRILEL
jgi:hypothetical protein